jgi:exonuclease III
MAATIFSSMATTASLVISLNIGGNSTIYGGLFDILRRVKPMFVFLQEVSVDSSTLTELVRRFGYLARVTVDLSAGKGLGVATVWREELLVEIQEVEVNRVQLVCCGGQSFLNVYVPTYGGKHSAWKRREFFGDILLRAVRGGVGRPILVGDWNCVLDDRDVELGVKGKKNVQLEELVKEFNYVDVFRVLYPDKLEFTWWRPRNSAARLDRMYVPRELVEKLVAVEHVVSLSDHHSLRVSFTSDFLKDEVSGDETGRQGRHGGPLYWKMNVRILEEEDFIVAFRVLWEEHILKKEEFIDVADWWDLSVKPAVQKLSKAYSVLRQKSRGDTQDFLFFLLEEAVRKKEAGEVLSIRARLRTMMLEDAWGFVLRSRFQQNVEEERASLYHVNRERHHGKRNCIDRIKVAEDVEEEDPVQVEKLVKDFFEPLFSGCHGRNGLNTGVPFVPAAGGAEVFLDPLVAMSEESRDKLEVVVTEEELLEIVKDLPSHKSPGIDGIPYEFFVVLFPFIGTVFCEVINCVLTRKRLTASMKKGVTRLLPKVEVVPEVGELRPITLLQTDYKITTKVLVRRMLPVLPEVIMSGQLCSIKGRNIMSGVVMLISTLLYLQLHKIKAALVSVDQWKAFDRVFVPFLLMVLKAMGFGEVFVDWVRMLHEGNTTRFILMKLTDPIEVLFSVRQGDPIALILYLIFVEPLLLRIRKELPGLVVGGTKVVDVPYVDDENVFITREEELLLIDKIFLEFESVSGALLNRSHKSKILGLGLWEEKMSWPLPWLKVVKELKIFGVYLTADYSTLLVKNWEEVVRKVRNCFMI